MKRKINFGILYLGGKMSNWLAQSRYNYEFDVATYVTFEDFKTTKETNSHYWIYIKFGV